MILSLRVKRFSTPILHFHPNLSKSIQRLPVAYPSSVSAYPAIPVSLSSPHAGENLMITSHDVVYHTLLMRISDRRQNSSVSSAVVLPLGIGVEPS